MGAARGEQPPGCERCERRRVALGFGLDVVELLMLTGQVEDAHTAALVIMIIRAAVLAVRLVDTVYRPPLH